jgi:hypothetical protein
MAARTAKVLGRPITLDTYSMARHVSSEVGSGTPEEKMLVAVGARLQAQRRRKSPYDLLACTNARDVCLYGPINVVTKDASGRTQYGAPWKRWAATSRDPSPQDILVAELAQTGRYDREMRYADDQAAAAIISEKKIRERAAEGWYWVGPIPGVNHKKVFAFTHVRNASPKLMVDRAINALSKEPAPAWRFAARAPRVTNAVLVVGLLAAAGIIGYGISTRSTRF